MAGVRRPVGAVGRWLLLLSAAAAQDAVVRVHSGAVLQQAVNSGTQHTLVAQHVDLRDLLDGPMCSEALCVNEQSHPDVTFVTIRGSCDAPFDGEGSGSFPALYPRQCVVLSNTDVFKADLRELWVHNVHVYSLSRWEPSINIFTISRGRVWLSRMGMQSDEGDTQLILMISTAGRTVLMDGFMADATHEDGPAVSTLGELSLENVVINNAYASFRFLKGAVHATGEDSRVRLSNVTLDDVSLPPVAAVDGSTLFADDFDIFNADTQEYDDALPLEAVAQGDFLTFEDEDLLAIQLEVEQLPLVDWVDLAPAPAPSEAESPDRSVSVGPGGMSRSTFGSTLFAAGIGAALIIAAVTLYVWRRQRRRRAGLGSEGAPDPERHVEEPKEDAEASQLTRDPSSLPTSTYTNTQQGSASGGGSRWWVGDMSLAMTSESAGLLESEAELSRGGQGSTDMSAARSRYRAPKTQGSTYTNTLILTTSTHYPQDPVQPLSPRSRIEMALDHVYTLDELLFGKYRIPRIGVASRRRGGQALVQFVEDVETRQPLAAKFFIAERHFLRERELYGVEALRDAMPELVDQQPGGWAPPGGNRTAPLPPCLVTDRGECMTEYMQAAGHNLFTTVQALGHVASKLADLHREGWVHRDIKPANLLWTPSTRSWSLLDFGCAARIGSHARLAYSIAYVAPEVLVAEEAGETEVKVLPSLDMWAIGVIAFEMLTERQIFPHVAMKEDIMDVALGRSPLPWEVEGEGEALLEKLGAFRTCILACLQRDPEQRIDCDAFLSSWTHVLMNRK